MNYWFKKLLLSECLKSKKYIILGIFEGGIILTRRRFIGTGVASLVGTIPIVNGLESILNAKSVQSSPKRITFEEARANVNLRQAYIDQLIREEFLHSYGYADIFYDHNRSMAMKASVEDRIRYFSDDRHIEDTRRRLEGLQTILKDYNGLNVLGKNSDILRYVNSKRNIPEFKGLKKKDREKKIVEFLQTPAGIGDFLHFRREEVIKRDKNQMNDAWGININYDYDFGSRTRAKAYIFKDVFEPYEYKHGDKTNIFQPTEETVRSGIRHELAHAENFFYGIHLDKDLIIDKSNYAKVAREVKSFVDESASHMAELEFSRQFNRGGSFFEKYHPSYILAALATKYYIIEKWIPLAKRWLVSEDNPYKSFTEKIFEHQFRKVMQVYDEVSAATTGLFKSTRN